LFLNWLIRVQTLDTLDSFHMRCQRRILSIKWNDFIPNVTVAATSDLDSIINIVRARRGLFSHVARFSRDSWCSSVQHPLYLLCLLEMDIFPILPGGDQLDDLAWSHLFRYWRVSDRYIFSATRSFTVEGSRYSLRPRRL